MRLMAFWKERVTVSEIVIFGIGALFGAICVISWALCEADKKDGDKHD